MAIFIPLVTKFDPKGINQGKSSLKKFGGVAGKIGLAAGAALAGIGTAALKMSSEFETSFARFTFWWVYPLTRLVSWRTPRDPWPTVR